MPFCFLLIYSFVVIFLGREMTCGARRASRCLFGPTEGPGKHRRASRTGKLPPSSLSLRRDSFFLSRWNLELSHPPTLSLDLELRCIERFRSRLSCLELRASEAVSGVTLPSKVRSRSCSCQTVRWEAGRCLVVPSSAYARASTTLSRSAPGPLCPRLIASECFHSACAESS